MAVLLPWGILMRRNSAAHRRVLILATICISDAGFSRFVGLFVHESTTFLGTYLYYEGGNLLIIVLMLLWDWKHDRIMRQFLWGALRDCNGSGGDGDLLQRNVANDLALVAGGLGAEDAVDVAHWSRDWISGVGLPVDRVDFTHQNESMLVCFLGWALSRGPAGFRLDVGFLF